MPKFTAGIVCGYLFGFIFAVNLIVNKDNPHLYTGQIDEIIPNTVTGCGNGIDWITLIRLEGTDQIHEYACIYMGEVGDIVEVYVP
jgi:hypothetical protein